MDNPSSITKKITLDDKYDGSGYTVLNADSIQQVHVEVTVDKASHTHYHAASDPKATGSNPIQVVSSCCDNINPDGITSCAEFKNKLRQYYKDLKLPKVAWLEEGKELSIVDHFVQLELTESEKPIGFEDIFQPVEGTQPIRILIEGQPGFGKTTLATKLVHDWATGKSYADFEFVFIVPLCELQERSLQDAIVQIGKRCNFQDSMHIFNCHMKNTLLILDGLDEISQTARAEINEILYKQMYGEITVVAFCRTDSFALSKEERTKLFGLPNMCKKFQDKQISTLGVTSDDNKRLFLEKFVPKSRLDNIMEHLSAHWKLFHSPLLLMLLSVIIQQNEDIKAITNTTKFYKQLFNCILKHSYTKRGHKISSDFDLFHLDSSPNAIQQTLRQFGMLSIPNILEYNLQFESNDSTDEIYQLGFLMNHKTLTFISSSTHYQGLHLTIVEFAVAFAFWVELKLKHFASVKNDLQLIVSHFLNTKGTSLVLPFLATLVEGEPDLLWSQIESSSGWFSLDFDLTVKLLSECESNNFTKSKCLKNFIPQYVELRGRGTCDTKLLELLTYGSKCGKTEKIAIDDRTDSKIFAVEIAPCCELEIKLLKGRFIVYGSMHHLNKIPRHGSLNELLHFAASSNCEIYCDKDSSDDLFGLMMKENLLRKIKFRFLANRIRSELDKSIVTQLVENDRVEHLELEKGPLFKVDMSDFCCAAAKSTRLMCVSFKGFSVDLYDLTSGRAKKYTLISLNFCDLTCRQTLFFNKFCHQLIIGDLRTVDPIIALPPSLLTINYYDDTIAHFLTKHPRWTSINSLVQIYTFDRNTNLSDASQWKKIQTLSINTLDETDQTWLAICIHSLSIINLAVEFIRVENCNLFQHLNNLWTANSRLKTILAGFLDMPAHESTLKDLIEGLECNHWQTVLFCCTQYDLNDYRKYLLSPNLRIADANQEAILAEIGIPPYDSRHNWRDNHLKMVSISRVQQSGPSQSDPACNLV